MPIPARPPAAAPATTITARDPAVPPGPPLTVKALIAWGEAHSEAALRRHAEQARAHLDALREGHRAFAEIERIAAQERVLEDQLAQLRERKAALRPGATRAPSYDTAVIRAWARENNVPCPPTGRVPQAVVDSWREHTAGHQLLGNQNTQ
ncbi:hypothetical protein ACEZCY_14555 [Streptacidiphilus sp. N1-12]|uniref:Lsr2 DNA-binding domain-containing protein n=2 Tax=Streptacidiphilus alkalitolerans TaxID=3342712 RepID=A0ABV6V9S7_9ACTN